MDGHEADSERARGGGQVASVVFHSGHDDGALDLSDSVGHIDDRPNRSIYGDDASG
jgi:hypothetical protein